MNWMGTGKPKYGHKREGNTRHGEHRSDIAPPSRTVRPAPYTIQRGGGVGALEASRDTETGQDRRPPGQRPFRDPLRSRELGRPWRIRGLGRQWRIRELGRPWRIRGLGRPWRDPPPKKISLGKIGAQSGTWGHSGGAGSWGRSGSAGTAKRIRGAGTAKRIRGTGTGGRCRGAGSGGCCQGAGSGGRCRGAGSGGCCQGAGSGGRCRGAGSGGRCRGAGSGLEEATTGRLATGTAGGLAILTEGGPALAANGGVLAWAANGGSEWAGTCRLALAVNGGGLGRAADDGRLVLARGRTLSRHRRTPSLHLSPVVSGRSTGDGNWPRARTAREWWRHRVPSPRRACRIPRSILRTGDQGGKKLGNKKTFQKTEKTKGEKGCRLLFAGRLFCHSHREHGARRRGDVE